MIARRLDAELPVGERNRGIRVVPLSRHVVGLRSRLALWMLTAAVACVLLIAAVNIANLWLARSLGRARDVALRAALGASPARIVRQHLTESTTLAVGAGAFGTLLAVVGLDLVRSLGAVELARLDEVRLDTSVLGWSLVLSLLTGTVVGIVPALLWRGHRRPFGDTSLRGTVGGTAARTIRRSLLVAEVALAIMLLVGAGLLIRSWWQLEGVDPGFRPERVLTMQIGAPALMVPAQRPSWAHSRFPGAVCRQRWTVRLGEVEPVFGQTGRVVLDITARTAHDGALKWTRTPSTPRAARSILATFPSTCALPSGGRWSLRRVLQRPGRQRKRSSAKSSCGPSRTSSSAPSSPPCCNARCARPRLATRRAPLETAHLPGHDGAGHDAVLPRETRPSGEAEAGTLPRLGGAGHLRPVHAEAGLGCKPRGRHALAGEAQAQLRSDGIALDIKTLRSPPAPADAERRPGDRQRSHLPGHDGAGHVLPRETRSGEAEAGTLPRLGGAGHLRPVHAEAGLGCKPRGRHAQLAGRSAGAAPLRRHAYRYAARARAAQQSAACGLLDRVTGKRVVVSLDGGRVRVRRKKRGPKTKKGRNRFHTDWKEPKLLILYVVGDDGRPSQTWAPIIDGTLRGPEAVFALLLSYARQIGLNAADKVLFIADGAPWIWRRIQRLIAALGLSPTQVLGLIDFYHAAKQLSDAVKLRHWSATQRTRWLNRTRGLLKRARVDEVITALRELCRGRTAGKIRTHLNYFLKNRHRFAYTTMVGLGLPRGSGAVESAIRRVINLRIKGASIYWLPESVDAILLLRSFYKSGRWNCLQRMAMTPVGVSA